MHLIEPGKLGFATCGVPSESMTELQLTRCYLCVICRRCLRSRLFRACRDTGALISGDERVRIVMNRTLRQWYGP